LSLFQFPNNIIPKLLIPCLCKFAWSEEFPSACIPLAGHDVKVNVWIKNEDTSGFSLHVECSLTN
jgi:hypothetical protein